MQRTTDPNRVTETDASSAQSKPKSRRRVWMILLCGVLLAFAVTAATAHVHRESLGDYRVTLCRFVNMNGLESARYLLKEEVLSKYPGEELNVDIVYRGRTLTGKLDYYYILIERNEDLIRCFAIDDMKSSEPPQILWDTAVVTPNSFQ